MALRKLLPIYQKLIKKFSKGYGISKSRITKPIFKKIESTLKSDFALVQGNKMFLDPTDSLDLSILGVYGELDTKTIKNKILPGDVVIDVGANIGYYTLIFAKLVGETGKVFAFEPEPSNFKLLKKNVEINGYKNVILENKAVSNNNGKIHLFLAKNGIVGHRIFKSDDVEATIEVDAVRLDDYFDKHNLAKKINFVKIDVEGAEFGVLLGMSQIIKKSDNIKIFTEFTRDTIAEAGFDPREELDFLYDNNFEIYFLNYKQNSISIANKNELLTSKEILEENTNLLCEKNKNLN